MRINNTLNAFDLTPLERKILVWSRFGVPLTRISALTNLTYADVGKQLDSIKLKREQESAFNSLFVGKAKAVATSTSV